MNDCEWMNGEQLLKMVEQPPAEAEMSAHTRTCMPTT